MAIKSRGVSKQITYSLIALVAIVIIIVLINFNSDSTSLSPTDAVDALPTDFIPSIGYTQGIGDGRLTLWNDEGEFFLYKPKEKQWYGPRTSADIASLPDNFIPTLGYYHPIATGRIVLWNAAGTVYVYNPATNKWNDQTSTLKPADPVANPGKLPTTFKPEVGYYYNRYTYEFTPECDALNRRIKILFETPEAEDTFNSGDTIDVAISVQNNLDEDMSFEIRAYLYEIDGATNTPLDFKRIERTEIEEGDDEDQIGHFNIPLDLTGVVDENNDFAIKVIVEESDAICNSAFTLVNIGDLPSGAKTGKVALWDAAGTVYVYDSATTLWTDETTTMASGATNKLPTNFKPATGYYHQIGGGRVILWSVDKDAYVYNPATDRWSNQTATLKDGTLGKLPTDFIPTVGYYNPFDGGRIILWGENRELFVYNPNADPPKWFDRTYAPPIDPVEPIIPTGETPVSPQYVPLPTDFIPTVGYYNGFGTGRIVLGNATGTLYIFNPTENKWNGPLTSTDIKGLPDNFIPTVGYYRDINNEKRISLWNSTGDFYNYNPDEGEFVGPVDVSGGVLKDFVPTVGYYNPFGDKGVVLGDVTGKVFVYNPTTKKWIDRTSTLRSGDDGKLPTDFLPTVGYHHQIGDGRISLWNAQGKVYLYNPTTAIWTDRTATLKSGALGKLPTDFIPTVGYYNPLGTGSIVLWGANRELFVYNPTTAVWRGTSYSPTDDPTTPEDPLGPGGGGGGGGGGSCSDSDGGVNYNLYGVARRGSTVYRDSCGLIGGVNKTIIEAYCEGRFPRTTAYLCPGGCTGGACVGTSNPEACSVEGREKCTDTYSFVCTNGQWVGGEQIPGKCRYAESSVDYECEFNDECVDGEVCSEEGYCEKEGISTGIIVILIVIVILILAAIGVAIFFIVRKQNNSMNPKPLGPAPGSITTTGKPKSI